MPNGLIGQMQGGPQQGPVPGRGAPPGPGQQGGVYPANQQDVANFITDIMRGLYTESQFDKIVQMLSQGDPVEMVGRTAGMLIMSILQRRKQSGGKPHQKLVIRGLHKAIMELADIAKMAGIAELSEEQLKESANIAGQVIENAMSGPQPGQAPGPGGPPQGGPPSGGGPPQAVPPPGPQQMSGGM
ncbi:MAG: hypothetical protein KAS93_08145 [Gammaproteobacteria bacterium]|nr:hypothetical protein [Gammaproteobacteria bacterium]